MSDFGCVYEGFLDFGVRYDYLKFTLKTATRIQKRYTIKGMGSSVCLIRRVNLQDFYVPVGVILPVLDGKSSANVDVNRATGVVRFSVIGMLARLSPNRDEPVS